MFEHALPLSMNVFDSGRCRSGGWRPKRRSSANQSRGTRTDKRIVRLTALPLCRGRVPGAPGGGRVAIPSREALMAPPSSRTQPGQNRLLALLPRGEQDRLFDNLERVSLTSKQVLARPGEPYS